MARKKQAALDVPATNEEARALLADYVRNERETIEIEVAYQRGIDEMKAERDRLLGTIADAQAGRFASLKAWWEAGGSKLAGKARSSELAGAKLGIRLTPPAVKFNTGVKATDIVAWLRAVRCWGRSKDFLRVKFTLDKAAIIKAVQTEKDVRQEFAAQGVGVVQIDEFYIDTGLDRDAIEKELTATV